METDERRDDPQTQQTQARVERTSRFDDESTQMAVFVAVVVLTLVALIVAAA